MPCTLSETLAAIAPDRLDAVASASASGTWPLPGSFAWMSISMFIRSAMNPECIFCRDAARDRARLYIARPESSLRESLVQVLDDRERIADLEVAVDQERNLPLGETRLIWSRQSRSPVEIRISS